MPYAYNSWTTDGSSGTVLVTFPFLEREHVSITLDGTVLPDTDYVWVNDSEITLNDIPAAGLLGEIKRTTPADETAVVFTAGSLSSRNLNDQSLQLLYIEQELLDADELLQGRAQDLEKRAILVPAPETAPAFPNQAARAKKVLTFDENGGFLPRDVAGVGMSTEDEAKEGEDPFFAISPATLKAALQDRVVSVWDFIPFIYHAGIRAGTYTGDCAPWFAAAIAVAVSKKMRLYVPGGHYYFDTQVLITDYAYMYGDGYQESPLPGGGTWLIHKNKSIRPFKFTGVASRGSGFRDLAFYQQHPTPAPGWAPENFDWLVDHDTTYGSLDFDNVYFCSIRKVVRSYMSGRLFMNRIKGQVHECLDDIDMAQDVPNFHDIHLWPFWIGGGDTKAWQVANCDYHRWKRVDTPVLSGKQFYFNARSAIRCSDVGNGTATRIDIGSLRAESCKYAIWADDTTTGVTGVCGAIDHFAEDVTPGTAIAGSNGIFLDGTQAHLQVAIMRSEIVAESYGKLNKHSNKLDIGLFKGANHNLSAGGHFPFFMANAVTGNVNRISLGNPPTIEPAGPLYNATTTNGQFIRPYGSGQGIDGLDYAYDTAGNRIVLNAVGAAAVIGIAMQSKGIGSDFRSFINGQLRSWHHDNSDANTYFEFVNGLNYIHMLAQGLGSKADIIFSPKGTGGMGVGIGTLSNNLKLEVGGIIGSTAAFPGFYLRETDQAVDARLWRIGVTNGALSIQIASDDESSATVALQVERSGNTLSRIIIGTHLQPNSTNSRNFGSNSARWASVHSTAAYFYGLADYADDTAAAAGGVLVGQLYRTASVVKVRVT